MGKSGQNFDFMFWFWKKDKLVSIYAKIVFYMQINGCLINQFNNLKLLNKLNVFT